MLVYVMGLEDYVTGTEELTCHGDGACHGEGRIDI